MLNKELKESQHSGKLLTPFLLVRVRIMQNILHSVRNFKTSQLLSLSLIKHPTLGEQNMHR